MCVFFSKEHVSAKLFTLAGKKKPRKPILFFFRTNFRNIEDESFILVKRHSDMIKNKPKTHQIRKHNRTAFPRMWFEHKQRREERESKSDKHKHKTSKTKKISSRLKCTKQITEKVLIETCVNRAICCEQSFACTTLSLKVLHANKTQYCSIH